MILLHFESTFWWQNITIRKYYSNRLLSMRPERWLCPNWRSIKLYYTFGNLQKWALSKLWSEDCLYLFNYNDICYMGQYINSCYMEKLLYFIVILELCLALWSRYPMNLLSCVNKLLSYNPDNMKRSSRWIYHRDFSTNNSGHSVRCPCAHVTICLSLSWLLLTFSLCACSSPCRSMIQLAQSAYVLTHPAISI